MKPVALLPIRWAQEIDNSVNSKLLVVCVHFSLVTQGFVLSLPTDSAILKFIKCVPNREKRIKREDV